MSGGAWEEAFPSIQSRKRCCWWRKRIGAGPSRWDDDAARPIIADR